MHARFRVAAVAVATALTAHALMQAAGTAKPGVDWPQFRGIRATGVAEGFACRPRWDVAGKTDVAWKTPIPGLGLSSPIVWGDRTVRQHRDQRPEGRRAQGRALRRRQAGHRRHRARVAHLLPRQEDRRGALAADRDQGGSEDQAAHQGDARELDAGDRRRAADRVLRVGRALRLRSQGQAALEEGPRRARCRVVHGPVGAMGNRQLADPARQRRRHPGRRAEGLVPRRVRRARRAASCGGRREQRRADVGHADRAPGERPDAAHRQRLEAHRRATTSRPARKSGS